MTETARPKAILVAVRLPDMDVAASKASLDDLTRLVTTLGYDVVERVLQGRGNLAPAAVLVTASCRRVAAGECNHAATPRGLGDHPR